MGQDRAEGLNAVLCLAADGVVQGDTLLEAGAVLVRAGQVEAIGLERELAPRADRCERLAGLLLPGCLDLQVNGAAGRGVEEATADALDAVSRAVLAGGATAFLPTLISAPFDTLLEQVARVAAWTRSGGPADGARPLGLHVEGPFLEVAGAHAPEHFLDPAPERIEALLAAAAGSLRLVTLAPSRRGAPAAVARLVQAGVAVSIGHAADASGLAECVAAGATLVTHLFNAMGALHHRQPGVAGHVLDDERLACCLVPDGHHVHPAMLRNAWRVLGAARTVLVSDSMAAAGMPDGCYELAGRPVVLDGGCVRDQEGRLAGSAIRMGEGLARFREAVPGVTPGELARIAARNPARLLGLEDPSLRPGARACFTLLGDSGARGLRFDRA